MASTAKRFSMKSPEEILKLIDIEKKLWTNDPEFYQTTLAEEAQLVFAETGVISRSFAVSAVRDEKASGKIWEEVAMDDVRNTYVSDEVVLLTYRAAAKWKNNDERIHCLASSLYVNKSGEWKLIFHQQTPIAENFQAMEINIQ